MKALKAIALSTLLLGNMVLAEAEKPKNDVMIILDASGSMWGRVNGKEKIAIAKDKVETVLKQLPPDVAVGLITYGHRREGDCTDIELVNTPKFRNRYGVIKHLRKISPKGKTPITDSIKFAIDNSRDGSMIVLVSDGKENCSGIDPCDYVKSIKGKNVTLKIHVVGFDVNEDEKRELSCVAQAGGGNYFSATSQDDLDKALTSVQKQIVEEFSEEAKQKIKGLHGQLADSKQKIEQLHDQLSESNQERDALRKRLEALEKNGQSYSEKSRDLTKKLKDMDEYAARLMAENDALQNELNRLKGALGEGNSPEQLQENLTELEKANASLKKLLAEREQQLQQGSNALMQENQRMKADLDAMSAELANLKRQYGHVTQGNDELNQRVMALQSEQEALLNDKRRLSEEVARVNQAYDKLMADNNLLRQQLNAMGNQLNAIRRDVEKVYADNAGLKDDIQEQWNKNYDLAQQNRQLQGDIADLLNQLRHAQGLLSQSQRYGADMSMKNQELENLLASHNQLMQDVERLMQDNNYLVGQLNTMSSENEALRVNRDRLRELLARLLHVSRNMIDQLQVMAIETDSQIIEELQ
jgi:chromosome segregation ATPase